MRQASVVPELAALQWRVIAHLTELARDQPIGPGEPDHQRNHRADGSRCHREPGLHRANRETVHR
jgi:hypothetical protein